MSLENQTQRKLGRQVLDVFSIRPIRYTKIKGDENFDLDENDGNAEGKEPNKAHMGKYGNFSLYLEASIGPDVDLDLPSESSRLLRFLLNDRSLGLMPSGASSHLRRSPMDANRPPGNGGRFGRRRVGPRPNRQGQGNQGGDQPPVRQADHRWPFPAAPAGMPSMLEIQRDIQRRNPDPHERQELVFSVGANRRLLQRWLNEHTLTHALQYINWRQYARWLNDPSIQVRRALTARVSMALARWAQGEVFVVVGADHNLLNPNTNWHRYIRPALLRRGIHINWLDDDGLTRRPLLPIGVPPPREFQLAERAGRIPDNIRMHHPVAPPRLRPPPPPRSPSSRSTSTFAAISPFLDNP